MNAYYTNLPIDAATGLHIQLIEFSSMDEDFDSLPQGWAVLSSTRLPKEPTQKWHEHSERRLIGPLAQVKAARA